MKFLCSLISCSIVAFSQTISRVFRGVQDCAPESLHIQSCVIMFLKLFKMHFLSATLYLVGACALRKHMTKSVYRQHWNTRQSYARTTDERNRVISSLTPFLHACSFARDNCLTRDSVCVKPALSIYGSEQWPPFLFPFLFIPQVNDNANRI